MEKTYFNWTDNIRDWCISRQLWWGHRIPAYYCDACGEIVVAAEKPDVCPKCGGLHFTQDEDVLDTWFSSALWPFSTLGWPEKTPDLDYFYPTDVLVTGYDIIFFWIVRMVFSGLETMGESPFKYVFVHGLVRDKDGQKMSKSLGNGIDPIEIIDHYGADALRFMLINGSAAGSDMRFLEEKIESSRNFANKLWNASRFVLMNVPDDFVPLLDEAALKDEDRWILLKTREAAADITRNLEHFELSVATQKIYELIWNAYCDWYIELVKPRLYGEDETDKKTAVSVLISVLSDLLRLLHPFMPYITEEIWGYLGKENKLIVDRWPRTDADALSDYSDYKEAYERIELAMNIIRSVRNIRAEAEASPGRKLTLTAVADGAGEIALIKSVESQIKNIANITELTAVQSLVGIDPGECATAVTDGFTLYVPLDDLVDYEAEKERLTKERDKLEAEIGRQTAKLANESFVSKAPEQVVQTERDKLAKAEDSYARVLARLEQVNEK
jgi:valyl-tRNA synthetase